MTQLFKTKTGRLRIIGFLEGLSLLILVFIAVPMKYMFGIPQGSQIVGSIHGALFLLFIINTLSLGVEQNWKFRQTTWKVLLASFIPFGTFYIDKKILSKVKDKYYA
jgi:integral membrane protein